jgi:hypothetical protein
VADGREHPPFRAPAAWHSCAPRAPPICVVHAADERRAHHRNGYTAGARVRFAVYTRAEPVLLAGEHPISVDAGDASGHERRTSRESCFYISVGEFLIERDSYTVRAHFTTGVGAF